MSELADLTVAEAAREIRAGRVSAVQLTSAVLARVHRLGRRLNPYITVREDAALAEAEALDARGGDGPLRGIPVCVKDVIDAAGLPTTAGAARWERRPERDATAVARLRAAGAVVIGKGHTNEFAYGIDGENPHWGNCSNPYDPTRICGGSSSGPAVATAAGMALAGLGTDTSGSIRMPSSLCGLVGVRPTLGRVARDGVVPLSWTYDTVGPLCRSVEDAALLLDVLLHDGLGRAPADRPLRLGVIEELMEAAESYVAQGVAEAIRELERDGAEVVPVRFARLRHADAIHQIVQHAEASQVHAPWFEEMQDQYAPPVRTRLEAGRLLPAGVYLAAQQARRLLIDEVAARMRGLDALLAPTAALVAPPHRTPEVIVRGVPRPLRAALQTCVVPPSELGSPVVSVPVGAHQGLPFGMQVIGRPGAEALLLRIAGQVEARWPWAERRPHV